MRGAHSTEHLLPGDRPAPWGGDLSSAGGWANCTVNDVTGDLHISSDWGSWSHHWNPHPSSFGAATLTAFIGTRRAVDYLARKLPREGKDGSRWSAAGTTREIRHRLCERRLEDGRAQLDGRLVPDDMPGGAPLQHLRSRYTDDGLPLCSHRMPATSSAGRPWDVHGDPYEPLPFLTRDAARRIWDAIGCLADDCAHSSDLFYAGVGRINGFTEYVTAEPWEHGETEQTPEDRALRDSVLPALIAACRTAIFINASPNTHL